jgi:hypothetical protein
MTESTQAEMGAAEMTELRGQFYDKLPPRLPTADERMRDLATRLGDLQGRAGVALLQLQLGQPDGALATLAAALEAPHA